MQVTISPWSALANTVVQMTVVCSITLKWERPLKMDPCHYPNQSIFQDVAYLNSPFTWKVMKSLHLSPGYCNPIQGKILKRKRAYLIIVCLEPKGLLRTVLEFLLQDGESFAEQFKQKLKLSRQLYKQPFVYTTTWDRHCFLLSGWLRWQLWWFRKYSARRVAQNHFSWWRFQCSL